MKHKITRQLKWILLTLLQSCHVLMQFIIIFDEMNIWYFRRVRMMKYSISRICISFEFFHDINDSNGYFAKFEETYSTSYVHAHLQLIMIPIQCSLVSKSTDYISLFKIALRSLTDFIYLFHLELTQIRWNVWIYASNTSKMYQTFCVNRNAFIANGRIDLYFLICSTFAFVCLLNFSALFVSMLHIFDGFVLFFIGFLHFVQIHFAYWFVIKVSVSPYYARTMDAYKYTNYAQSKCELNSCFLLEKNFGTFIAIINQ